MDVVKNPGTWKEIAYWLNIEQLVALLLSGNRWMISVISRAPFLHVNGRYYVIADLLLGLDKWTIPESYAVSPDNGGIISFPPQLKSLSVPLLTRLSAEVQAVDLPDSLTSLEVNNDPTYHSKTDSWAAWTTAIRTLTGLRSVSIAHESQAILTGQFTVLGGSYPYLTSLTIGTLVNTSQIVFHDLLPLSLTQLSISVITTDANVRNVIPTIRNVVPTLTNLLSLTLSGKCFTQSDHYLIKNLPAQLRELVIVDIRRPPAPYYEYYYIPGEMLSELPRTLTALDAWTFLPNDKSLTSLEQLPLTALKLRSAHGVPMGNFAGNFPTLKLLELTNFLTVRVPPSVRSLKVTASPAGSVDVLGNTSLQKLNIQNLSQLPNNSRTMATFHTLTSFSTDLSRTGVSTFLSWLDPLILQSLTISLEYPTIAIEIMGWLSSETKVLTTLAIHSNFNERFHDNPLSELPFDLPSSLTSVSLTFPRSNKLRLSTIPPNLTHLQLVGITIDPTQISGLTELKRLLVDGEAITGVIDFQKGTRKQLERLMMNFLLTLPHQLAKIVITRVQLELSVSTPGTDLSPPVAQYDLYQWFNTSCDQRDARSTVAEIMLTLAPSYLTLPYQ